VREFLTDTLTPPTGLPSRFTLANPEHGTPSHSGSIHIPLGDYQRNLFLKKYKFI